MTVQTGPTPPAARPPASSPEPPAGPGNVPAVAWVGVDVGKLAHHVAAIDAEGRLLWSRPLRNDEAEINQMIELAGQTALQARWAVDLTSAGAPLLLALLAAAGQPVVYVPGRVVKRMSESFPGEGKTDARDARIIAETARMRRDLAAVTLTDQLVVELGVLTAHRTDLMADWVRGVNRLRDMLTRVFPALERALDFTAQAPLILVSGYATPEAIRAAGQEQLALFLRSHGAQSAVVRGTAHKATAAAAEQSVTLPGEQITSALVMGLARKLLDLRAEIKSTDKLITRKFRSHPHAQVLESIPGMGPILGAEFIAITAGDMTAFGSPARLAAYAGLAPVPNDSGKRTGILHRPRRYHRRLRRVFFMAAFASIGRDGPSRAFYQRKRAERQHHSKATIALARRMVDVTWALLRDGRTWQPEPPNPALST